MTSTPSPASDSRAFRRGQSRGQASRERIMSEMLRLVDERGYEGATISELVRRVALPASSIYWHFSNKDDLLAAAITHSYESRLAAAGTWPALPDSRELVDQLAYRLANLAGDGREADHARIGSTLGLQRNTGAPAAREAYLNLRRHAAAALVGWWQPVLADLGADADPRRAEIMARLTLATLDGRYLTGQDITLTEEHTRVLAQILAGCAQHVATWAKLPEALAVDPLASTDWSGHFAGREALIKAAIEVMCDLGPHGATVQRICEQAGLPASSLYWHFENLDELLAEAVDAAFDTWRRDVLPGVLPQSVIADPSAALATSLRIGFLGMLHHPHAFRIGFMLLLHRGDSPARDRFRAIRREILGDRARWFATWLGQGAPRGDIIRVTEETLVGQLSWALMTMADGLFMSEATTPLWPLEETSAIVAVGIETVATAAGERPATRELPSTGGPARTGADSGEDGA